MLSTELCESIAAVGEHGEDGGGKTDRGMFLIGRHLEAWLWHALPVGSEYYGGVWRSSGGVATSIMVWFPDAYACGAWVCEAFGIADGMTMEETVSEGIVLWEQHKSTLMGAAIGELGRWSSGAALGYLPNEHVGEEGTVVVETAERFFHSMCNGGEGSWVSGAGHENDFQDEGEAIIGRMRLRFGRRGARVRNFMK